MNTTENIAIAIDLLAEGCDADMVFFLCDVTEEAVEAALSVLLPLV